MTGSRAESLRVHAHLYVYLLTITKNILRRIESVFEPNFSDFEILVTDDGLSDGTVDVVKSFSDPRIRLFQLPRNQGSSVAARQQFS